MQTAEQPDTIMAYIPRNAEPGIQYLASGYPVVVVTGPRQSGKSTLVKHAFPDHHYVSLEDLDQRELAELDPRGFLNQLSGSTILDEAQHCPALFSYIQTRVDERQQPGEFILTGSQQFGLLPGITQSRAGRAALLTLLPMTYGELGYAKKLARTSIKHSLMVPSPLFTTACLIRTPGMKTMCELILNEMSDN